MKCFLIAALAATEALAFSGRARAAEPSAAPGPDFQEVYTVIKQNLAGATEQELNHAAVRGLISQLKPRVTLLTNNGSEQSKTNTPVVLKTNLFDGPVAYIRVGQVADGLAKQVQQSFRSLNSGETKLKGLVLDLRFAKGESYLAAASTADLFIHKRQQLLKWADGSAQSTEKTDAITVPVAALVNHETAAAAEALAAVLRQTGVGLVIGNRTAGEAMVSKDFQLKNGDKLRIAVSRIEVGDTSTIGPDGVKPDIQVDVPAEDERAYFADAFKVIEKPGLLAVNTTLSLTNAPNGTNHTRRVRFNEAELVRERREGINPDVEAEALIGAGKEEPDVPIVHDPVLARALDLLKGLAVVRHTGS